MTHQRGTWVTETFDYDGGRKVAAYVSARPAEAAVFGGDGQLFSQWGAVVEAAGLPPTMIVAAYRTDADDEMARIGEYSPAIEPERFAAHEKFFVHDVRAWVRSSLGVHLPPARTVVAGVSAGAELALALGIRHPDIYGTVFAASPGAGYQPPASLPQTLPRVYLTAGTLEPFFLENATRWYGALQAHGADTVLTRPVGEHGGPFWAAELARMLRWALA